MLACLEKWSGPNVPDAIARQGPGPDRRAVLLPVVQFCSQYFALYPLLPVCESVCELTLVTPVCNG